MLWYALGVGGLYNRVVASPVTVAILALSSELSPKQTAYSLPHPPLNLLQTSAASGPGVKHDGFSAQHR